MGFKKWIGYTGLIMNKYIDFYSDVKNYMVNQLNVDIRDEFRFFRRTRKYNDDIALEIIIKEFIEYHPILSVKLIHWFIQLGREYYQVEEEYIVFVEKLFDLRPLYDNYRRRIYYHSVSTPFREKQKFNKNNSNIKKKSKEQKEKEEWRKNKFKKKDKQKSHKYGWKKSVLRNGYKALRQDTRQKLRNGQYDDLKDIDFFADPWSWW